MSALDILLLCEVGSVNSRKLQKAKAKSQTNYKVNIRNLGTKRFKAA
jgi:hypothetical protein